MKSLPVASQEALYVSVVVYENMLPFLEEEAKKRQGNRTDIDKEITEKFDGK